MIDKKKDNFLMSFGKMPIANNFLHENDFSEEFFYEMKVGFNEEYSLFKLLEHPEPKQMFNSKYPFLTSSSNLMIQHFNNFYKFIKENYLQSTNEKIIEIGCNDGTMLNFFENKKACIGFEPSTNVAKIAEKKDLKIIPNFFSSYYPEAKKFLNDTKIIYAANVICHIPDLNNLIDSIDKFLNKKGLFIFEEPYLGSMIYKNSYDQIYDEHVYIFSVSAIKKIFKQYEFDLIEVVPQTTHGGSMRYIIARKGEYEITKSVEVYENKEKQKNIDNFDGMLNFKRECNLSKDKIVNQLQTFKKNGKTISGYAATSKSTTILNYCKIGTDLINCIYDTTPDKIGKFSPGMHIPIRDYKEFNNEYPDIVYLFAWNHKEEIFNKEKNFIKNGGEWFSHVKI